MPRTIRRYLSNKGRQQAKSFADGFIELRDCEADLPEDLYNALTEYAEDLNILSDNRSASKKKDEACAHLAGLNQFLINNYDRLLEAVDPPEMGKFAEMLHKADDLFEMGINWDRLYKEEQEKKDAFLNDVHYYQDVLNGLKQDAELLDLFYDSRINADGSVNTAIDKQLDEYRRRSFNNLSRSNTRETALNDMRQLLERVPAEERTEKQQAALSMVRNELKNLPAMKEAEQFAQDVYDRGWMSPASTFRNMYLAGKQLPPDHDYNKLLQEMREGKSRSYPQFPVKKRMDSGYPDFGLIQGTQTIAAFDTAAELLKSSGMADTYEGKKALKAMDEKQGLRSQVKRDEEDLQKWSKWTSLSAEQRAQMKTLKDLLETEIRNEEDSKKLNGLYPAREQLTYALYDPQEIWYHGDADKASAAVDKLPEALSKMLETVGYDHPAYDMGFKLLSELSPEAAAAYQTRAAENDLAQAQAAGNAAMEAFDREIADFKVMKENLDRVRKSYFNHDDSTQYTNMLTELQSCIDAKSPEELKAAKGRLATKTQEYLEHTTLGRASKLHPNAEIRRKMAFYMMSKTDETAFADYAQRANRLRGAADRIDAAALAQTEGIGKPVPKVRTVNAADLAGDAPAQPERKSHARKKEAVNANGKINDLKSPTIGPMNNPN